jgi:PH (Pleckstrin Homology) domain-containing protein
VIGLTVVTCRIFRFVKRYFYLSDEAVEIKQLSAVAHPIAAWASQTGRGLLFFTKRAEDKATPVGIFNLVRRITQSHDKSLSLTSDSQISPI